MAQRKPNFNRRSYFSNSSQKRKYQNKPHTRKMRLNNYRQEYRNKNRINKRSKNLVVRPSTDWRKDYKPTYETNIKYNFRPMVLTTDMIEYILSI